jgi:hypothetical protein
VDYAFIPQEDGTLTAINLNDDSMDEPSDEPLLAEGMDPNNGEIEPFYGEPGSPEELIANANGSEGEVLNLDEEQPIEGVDPNDEAIEPGFDDEYPDQFAGQDPELDSLEADAEMEEPYYADETEDEFAADDLAMDDAMDDMDMDDMDSTDLDMA